MPDMGRWLIALLRRALSVLLCLFSFAAGVNAQSPAGGTSLKEVQIPQASFTLGEPVPAWVEQASVAEASQTGALVLPLVDTQYMLSEEPVVYVHRSVRVNDAASLTQAGHVAVVFVPQYQRLRLHAIRLLRGAETFDRTNSSPVRFLQRETGLEQGVYSGEVTASVLVSDLRVGDTLEYEYSTVGQNPVFGGKFVQSASWDQGYPTALRRIVLNYPVGRHIAWRLIGDAPNKPLVPQESVVGGMRRLVFEERSLTSVTPEPMTPPDYATYRWMQFSEFESWAEVVAWADELFQWHGELKGELRELVETLKAKATPEERVVGALEFVQSQIRYFSVSMGESSHRPTQPDLVLEHRYGDCKDKSLLLLTVLRALGIEGKPVLLEIGRRNRIDKALPSPLLFNHAIVQVEVGGRAFYLDPTRLGQHGRLSQMGQVHEGAHVLIVAPQGQQLATIVSDNGKELTHAETRETVTLPKLDGEARMEVRHVWRGAVAEGLRVMHERLPREQIVKSIGQALEARYPGATLLGTPDISDDRERNVLTITAEYSVPKFATERDGNWFVRYSPDNMKGLLARAAQTRKVPLKLPVFPYEASYALEVRFPDEVTSVTDPRTDAVNSKFFTYSVTSSFRGSIARTNIRLTTLADQVPVADLQKYSDDLQSMSKILAGVMIIPKGAIKSAKAGRGGKMDLSQMLRERLAETVDKTSQAIKSGKLAGADLANSHCLRSNAYSDLGKFTEARADADEAVKLIPNSPTVLMCRAAAHFSAGEFEKSVEDYSKAITLGATDAKVLHLRGMAKFYAGRLEDAADDFLRAADTDDREAQVMNDLWLAWSHQRLGRPLPQAVRQRAANEPRGAWPRPALALLTGDVTAEEMLKLIERKSGDERTMALCEGYFYLAQYYLGRGETAKARKLFEDARRLNVIIYVEHTAAGFELQRLGASTETGAVAAPSVSGSHLGPSTAGAVGPQSSQKKAAPKGAGKAPDSWNQDLWRRQ
jgi:lipoprotein NlpI/transglutaminase-like putative cysteine protease